MTSQAYPFLDRLLHRLAFGGLKAQVAMADIEDRIFRAAMAAETADRPVFITSLPRAGTTLLLEVLNELGGFATHTYRDMPFVLCPLLWDRLSGPYRRAAEPRERAHGDGMLVGFDSPEAFEEIIWRAFWPERFGKTRIGIWTAADRDAEFEDFFRAHLRKLALLRGRGDHPRYVSKNNANVARVELLPAIFPDCSIVIPFRDPVQQAGSLLRQHENFSRRHAQDPFARAYMADIGHYEFGDNLRAIKFDGAEALKALDPMTLDYWLEYWILAFEHLLKRRGPNVTFISYDDLAARPVEGLRRLAAAVGLDDHSRIEALAGRFRAPAPHDGSGGGPRERRARAVFETLRSCSAEL